MSTRLKVFLIITAIILAITASSILISISSAQSQILRTLEDNVQSMVSVANEYVLGEILSLKEEAAAVAFALEGRSIHLIQPFLVEQLAAYDYFEAITVFSAAGMELVTHSQGGLHGAMRKF